MKQVKRTARRNEAAATGERGNTTSLVGAPEQVAEGMLEYYALGVTTFLTRGFDPLKDAIDYGRELIPIVRREIARREAGVHAHLAKRGGLSVRSQAYSPSP
jgi:alkanesulfonate monooxygenase SsuD/methylene tetrahydromethanopterin reductase-like flavin-dependent oxidoreductase (luciferase family)